MDENTKKLFNSLFLWDLLNEEDPKMKKSPKPGQKAPSKTTGNEFFDAYRKKKMETLDWQKKFIQEEIKKYGK